MNYPQLNIKCACATSSARHTVVNAKFFKSGQIRDTSMIKGLDEVTHIGQALELGWFACPIGVST